MPNLLNDECIEILCGGCKQMIPRSFGYLKSRTYDICLCGKVTNLRMGNFAIAISDMESAARARAEVLSRLGSIAKVRTHG